MEVQTETDREFWRSALVAGGFSAIPRWTRDPAAGTAEHEAKMPDDLMATLRRLADELSVTVSSVLLAAHAKVVATLSGEREVSTGYIGQQGSQPLLCRLTTEPDSWRTLLLAAHRAESELLAHGDFPVEELRRDLGLSEPSFETVLDPSGLDPSGIGGWIRVGWIRVGWIRLAAMAIFLGTPCCGWVLRATTASWG